MKFTYNIGDKLVAKEIKTVGNFFNHYVPAGSIVTLLENINTHKGYELIKVKTPNGVNFTTSAAYFDPYVEEENHNSEKDNVIEKLTNFIVDNLDEEDLDEFIATVAVVIENAYPGFLEKYNKSKEKCHEGNSCNCSDCKPSKEKKKPYTGKVCFIGETSRNYTKGKIYGIFDGITVDEQGQSVYFIFDDDTGDLITSFEELDAIMPHKWIEVIDEQESRLSKFYSGKVLCIAGSDVEGFTAGKVYEIVCGTLETDRGVAVTYANNLFESVEQINKYCIAQFMEITE